MPNMGILILTSPSPVLPVAAVGLMFLLVVGILSLQIDTVNGGVSAVLGNNVRYGDVLSTRHHTSRVQPVLVDWPGGPPVRRH